MNVITSVEIAWSLIYSIVLGVGIFLLYNTGKLTVFCIKFAFSHIIFVLSDSVSKNMREYFFEVFKKNQNSSFTTIELTIYDFVFILIFSLAYAVFSYFFFDGVFRIIPLFLVVIIFFLLRIFFGNKSDRFLSLCAKSILSIAVFPLFIFLRSARFVYQFAKNVTFFIKNDKYSP